MLKLAVYTMSVLGSLLVAVSSAEATTYIVPSSPLDDSTMAQLISEVRQFVGPNAIYLSKDTAGRPCRLTISDNGSSGITLSGVKPLDLGLPALNGELTYYLLNLSLDTTPNTGERHMRLAIVARQTEGESYVDIIDITTENGLPTAAQYGIVGPVNGGSNILPGDVFSDEDFVFRPACNGLTKQP